MTYTKEERQKIYWRAATRFRAMLPQLESFAQGATGRRINIIPGGMSGVSSTDGSSIMITPPFELGFDLPHDRNRCDKVDSLGYQTCNACAVREEITVNLYHEIGHIALGTFNGDPAKIDWGKLLVQFGIKQPRGAFDGDLYRNTSKKVDPHLQLMMNALEDVRVDRGMYKSRPGLERMSLMSDRAIAEVGILTPDGNRIRLTEQPIDSQILTSCYFAGKYGHLTPGMYSPEVHGLHEDEALAKLVEESIRTTCAEDTFVLGIKLLKRIRELGYLHNEETFEPEPEPKPEPEPEPEPEEDKDEQGQPGSDDGLDNDPGEKEDSESGQSDDQSDPAEPGSDPGSDSVPGEDSDSGDEGDEQAGSDSGSDTESGEEESAAEGDEGSESPSEEPDGSGSGDEAPGSSEDSDGDSEPAGSDGGGDQPGEQPSSGSPDDGEFDPDSGADTGGSDLGDPGDQAGSDAPSDANGANQGTGEVNPSGEPGQSDGDSQASSAQGDRLGKEATQSSSSDPSASTSTAADGAPDPQPPYADTPNAAQDGTHGQPAHDADVPTVAPRKPQTFEEYLEQHGTLEEIKEALEAILGHPIDHDETSDKEMEVAVAQAENFEESSTNIKGVIENHPDASASWLGADEADDHYEDEAFKKVDGWKPNPAIMSKALMKMRRAFEDNKRSRHEKNRKSGRVNSRALGRRAPHGDPRLFQKKEIPSKKDYAVVISVDISGSTYGGTRLADEKKAVIAQAELMSRVGVDFAIVAHTGMDIYRGDPQGRPVGMYLDTFIVKDWNDPWGKHQLDSLNKLQPISANIDGHAFEYMRRMVEKHPAKGKLIMYMSDGSMPLENFKEELRILKRELAYCKRKGIGVAAVGIQNNDPEAKYGIPMVLVESESDILPVVDHVAASLGIG